MKKLIFSLCFPLLFLSGYSQTKKADVLQNLENARAVMQDTGITATIRTATRLFKDKEDLTSVMLVIPVDSTVAVIDSDDTFLHVSFNGLEGYIYARHAGINKPVAVTKPAPRPQQEEMNDEQQVQSQRPLQQRQRMSRYEYLENKYGTSIADKLYAGKIWKGMTPEMVKDSWGSPKKINRVINGNEVREEWIYNDTWLYMQNDELVQWGPTKR